MLVNGTTLAYKTSAEGTSYTDLPDLKEVPDMGADPEMVDNTALSDSIVHNEQGIGDAGDMEYTFRYKNDSANDSFRIVQGLVGNLTYFKHTLKDGTAYTFSAIPSLKLSGGGVNDPQEFVMALALQSDLTIANPQ